MSGAPCHSRKSRKECEPAGLLARFMNCSWDTTSSLCLGPTQKIPKDPRHLQRPTPNAEKPTTFVTAKSGRGGIGGGSSGEEGGDLPRHLSKDCQVPACRTKTSAFARMMGRPNGKGKGGVATQGRDEKYTLESFAKSDQCPAGREDLGSHSWVLLHSIAAYYPDSPSTEDRTRAKQFVEAIGHFYPCTHCAEAFREDLKTTPPKVESRADFSVWMCNMHNKVNAKLDKPTFPCDLATLDARWKTGHASCWSGGSELASDSLGQSK
jgi:mitochondrial FAD-linked sulfhydryl oxidase